MNRFDEAISDDGGEEISDEAIEAADARHLETMNLASEIFLERLRAEREGREAGSSQYIMRLT